MERVPGYYWVLNDCLVGPEWMIAHWDGRWWALPGNEWDLNDWDFIKINSERLPEPK